MATYNVRGATNQTTGLSTVDTVTFQDACAGFRVVNRGAVNLWVRADGVDPAAMGDGSCLVMPNEVRVFMDPGAAKEIRLTAGAFLCAYTVEQVR